MGAVKEAEQWLVPPGGTVTLAMLKRSLGWSTFLVLEGRSGKPRDGKHLGSWMLKVISRRGCISVVASGCFTVLVAAGLCFWVRAGLVI